MTKSEIVDYVRRAVTRLDVPADGSHPVDIQVKVTGSIRRPTSQVWFVDLVSGQQVTSIVVKCEALGTATHRQWLPRLTPGAPAPVMIPRQALALQVIDREFMELSDPRFVSVRALMHDADRRILIMTRLPGDELLQRLHAAALPSGVGGPEGLAGFFENGREVAAPFSRPSKPATGCPDLCSALGAAEPGYGLAEQYLSGGPSLVRARSEAHL